MFNPKKKSPVVIHICIKSKHQFKVFFVCGLQVKYLDFSLFAPFYLQNTTGKVTFEQFYTFL